MQTFKFWFVVAMMTITVTTQAQNNPNNPIPCCNKNLVQNGQFNGNCSMNSINNIDNSCVPPWLRGTNTPQLNLSGHLSPASCIGMWGNQAVGESIYQLVSIQQNYRYRITCSVRTGDAKGIYFSFRASNSAPGNGGILMGKTPTIFPADGWVRITIADWTANNNYTIFNIRPENQFNVNDGTKTSYGLIDDVCVEVLPPCEQINQLALSGPTVICEGSPVTYSVSNFPGAAYSWSTTPTVTFSGNGSPSITVSGPQTVGKTSLTVTLKITCGGITVTKTFTTAIKKPINDPNFALSLATSGSTYGIAGVPTVGTGYNHFWFLYQSNTPFNNCSSPFPAGTIAVGPAQSTVNCNYANLSFGKYYLLMHYVQNCDGSWIVARKCFKLDVPQGRINPGTPIQTSAPNLRTPEQGISTEEMQKAEMNFELMIKN